MRDKPSTHVRLQVANTTTKFTLDVEVFYHAGLKQEKKMVDRGDVSAEFRMPFVCFYSCEWRSLLGMPYENSTLALVNKAFSII